LDITDTAKAKLASMLMGRAGTKEGFRLVPSHSGELGLVIDRQYTNDLAIEHQGVKVLFVSAEIAATLRDATLDVQCKDGSPTLVIRREEPASPASAL